MKQIFDWKEYARVSRQAGAEGCVLLKNEGVLPLAKGSKVAMFGRSQFEYIKSGTGSGGLVNVPYVVNIYEGLKASQWVEVDETVCDIYRNWIKDHPFDKGVGWANEPFSQVEMPLDASDVAVASTCNDVAIITISRLSGEDRDNEAIEGSYLLQQAEKDMIALVCKYFSKVAVLINSGNIIDMKWVNEINPAAVLYVWQGGVEGGNSVADILTGKVNPSGRLADTIAHDITDYPSTANFGDKLYNVYAEDIYVGYRYFETFAKDKVLYPFGFGLSYTEFKHETEVKYERFSVKVLVKVTNIGSLAGKEVVQVYYEAPIGKLGKPARELVGYAKTGVIAPGESETAEVTFSIHDMASFDDSGVTGNYHAFVLETGSYVIYEGKNVREAVEVDRININDRIVCERTGEALAPMDSFKRMVNNGTGKIVYEDVPVRRDGQLARIAKAKEQMVEIPYAGSQKYKLKDVANGNITLDEFVAGLTDLDMIHLTRGEGMCSPKVTAGTAAAFGGVTDTLQSYGIPAMCCSDGPSGIRMDSGVNAGQGPNGVSLACTFNKEIVEQLYEFVGKELRLHKIDSLLGPGMNIHRSPLNGRNFEYFSEDPILTGTMAAAELKGMHKSKVTGTIKHYACNNQELGRQTSDSVVSARALREIYLKGYEIAVKDGGAYMIMSTYGSLNGTYTAGNFDLNDVVLRQDWGYEGLVETDWWAKVNDEKQEASKEYTKFMIRGANDVYMVTASAEGNANNDNAEEGLKDGTYSRAELQRNAKRILKVAMRTLAFDRMNGFEEEWDQINRPEGSGSGKLNEISLKIDGETSIDASLIDTTKGTDNLLNIQFAERGKYTMYFEAAAEGSELSQSSMTIKINGTPKLMVARNGAEHDFRPEHLALESHMGVQVYVGITCGQDGMKLRNIVIKKDE